MTLYVCHCGEVHDSADGGRPCAIMIATLPGVFVLSRMDRFRILAALRKLHPTPSASMEDLIRRLSPSDDEARQWLDDDRREVEGQLRRFNPRRQVQP